MQTVAVALIDALGFKGIWRSIDHARVLETLRLFRQVARGMNAAVNQWPSPVAFHAQSVSDTVIFAAATSEPTAGARLLELLAPAVARFTRNALMGELPLAFRGCITVGESLLEEGILVGEAIDCAAENYERADAACVWLHPDARHIVESIDSKTRSGYWFPYEVPLVERKLKPGESSVVRTLVLNPCGSTWAPQEHERLSRQMQIAFNRGPDATRSDVERKRQLTAQFLTECSRASRHWWSEQGMPGIESS